MEGELNDIDLSDFMDSYPAQEDMEAYGNIQDFETLLFSSVINSMVSVSDNFPTGGVDITSANTMDSFPWYISSSYSQNSNNADSEFQLESSIVNSTCYNMSGQDFPTTSSYMPVGENAHSSGIRLKHEDTKQPTYKQRARKNFVPECAKDELYWKKRKQNNEASKKSRDEKKMREQQIDLRILELESQIASIKEEMGIIKAENHRLREALRRYIDTGINAYL